MSFNTSLAQPVARKAHRCTWCGESIDIGTAYFRWVTFDDSAFASKMHSECYDACGEEMEHWGDGEYSAFDNERPKT